MSAPKTIYLREKENDNGTLLIASELRCDGDPEYRLVEECKWVVTHRPDMGKVLNELFVDCHYIHDTDCGKFGQRKYGDFCSCGGRIVVDEGD